MKKPEKIIQERLVRCYGFKESDAAECARTLMEDVTAFYNVTELPYLAQQTQKRIREVFPREVA